MFGQVERHGLILIEAVQRREKSMPDDSLTYHLSRFTSMYRFEPQNTTFDELIGTGDLSILKSDELRTAMHDYLGFVDELQVRAMGLNNLMQFELPPGLDLLAATPLWEPEGLIQPDWREMTSTVAFRNFVVLRGPGADRVSRTHEAGLASLMKIRELLTRR